MLRVAANPALREDLGDDPRRQLRLGLDRQLRWLEVIVLTGDDGTELVIHAMKMRRRYERLLRERGVIR